MLNDIPVQASRGDHGYWPRLISRALLADLGPVLIFAPRRKTAEELAQSFAGCFALEEPMPISHEQAVAAGEPLAKLLRQRVAYHHSGLSYAVSAGIIEPLAKRGQLRVVVATMGLGCRNQLLDALSSGRWHSLHGRQFSTPSPSGRVITNVWPSRATRTRRAGIRAGDP